MAIECWFSGADKYLRELAELGCKNLIIYRGATARRRINAHALLKAYMGQIEWQALMVGSQGAALLTRENDMHNPKAVYPVWCYKDHSFDLLEEYCKVNVGDDPAWYGSERLLDDERPVRGQEHRIIIRGIRVFNRPVFMDQLWDLKEKYPEAQFHIMDSISYSDMTLGPFMAGALDAFMLARVGDMVLPTGRRVKSFDISHYLRDRYWFNLCEGVKENLKTNRDFCLFNMRSWTWACRYYTEETLQQRKTYNSSAYVPADEESPTAAYSPPQASSSTIGRLGPILDSDRIACDFCSLTQNCKYYRDGAVCGVPGTDARKLADLFRRRDHGSLVEAMGQVLSIQAQRLENAVTNEELNDEGLLDPEVNKIVKSLLDGGEKLAKLANPQLFRPQTNIQTNILNQNGGKAAIAAGPEISPKQVIANAVRELIATGIPIEKIDESLVKAYIAGEVIIADGHLAITGNVPEEDPL